MKRNYEKLNVDFDLWNGESTVQYLIPGMVEEMKKGGYAHESDGALVVDVKEETDTKEVPPCIILKSDGAALYSTTIWRPSRSGRKNIIRTPSSISPTSVSPCILSRFSAARERPVWWKREPALRISVSER